ncbi:hypothetical protein FKW77_005476 [Venturia effusa]|uniref:Uncharacterized protein n=1 Tax=Venturia effusa TaxID=50376 RepID=A0A517LIS3_9PEZI|nr:hypothetical protein FKW77_005476 [Venturia effusa]
MRLLPIIATGVLATRTLASSEDFERKVGDEIRLRPEKSEGIPFRHQVPEKGQRHAAENEDLKMDGWRRGFSELKGSAKPAFKRLEKRKGGGGGFSSGGFSSGGRSGGSSFFSGSKGSTLSSGGRSSGSSFFSGSRGSTLSSGSSYRGGSTRNGLVGFGAGALTGGALGWLAGTHHHDSSDQHNHHHTSTQPNSPCPPDCRCDNKHDSRLYFTLPPALSSQNNVTNITISVKTTWAMSYPSKLRNRLVKDVGLVSIPDPRERCGWHVVQDVWETGVHRGFVEYNVPNPNPNPNPNSITNNNNKPSYGMPSTTPFPPALQSQIVRVMQSTYPVTEIGLILGLAFGLFGLAALCCYGGLRRRRNRLEKKRAGKKGGYPFATQPQDGLYPSSMGYEGVPRPPPPVYSYPHSQY